MRIKPAIVLTSLLISVVTCAVTFGVGISRASSIADCPSILPEQFSYVNRSRHDDLYVDVCVVARILERYRRNLIQHTKKLNPGEKLSDDVVFDYQLARLDRTLLQINNEYLTKQTQLVIDDMMKQVEDRTILSKYNAPTNAISIKR